MDARATSRLKVWIDQDLCTGDGICMDHTPDVFTILEDGIAYVVEEGVVLNDPGGSRSLATVPMHCEEAVIASAGECPGECIFVEVVDLPGLPGAAKRPSVGKATV